MTIDAKVDVFTHVHNHAIYILGSDLFPLVALI